MTSLGLTLAVLLAACTASSAGQGQPSPATDADRTITSHDLAFDVATLAVPAGSTFSLQLTNLDAAPHNVAIYRDPSAGDEVFVGEVISSSSIVYEVPAVEPGSYFFRCDVHPDMNGTLVAG
jgi:plastocyanin